EGPAAEDGGHGDAVSVAVPGRRIERRLGVRSGGGDVAAALADDCCLDESRRLTVSARGIACECDRRFCSLVCLIGVAEEPERERRPAVTGHAWVVAVGGGGEVDVAAVVRGKTVLGMLKRVVEAALVEESAGEQLVG